MTEPKAVEAASAVAQANKRAENMAFLLLMG
jgi:hypothetical protein